MGGLENLYKKIIPIITLICFICFGIMTTFDSNNENNLTYLETQYIDNTTFQPIDNPTEEQKAESTKFYTFNMVEYVENIDQNILKRSIEHTTDFDTYENTLNQFTIIWQDGYQLFDVSKTIATGIVLVINTIILPINILLVPIRIISGITLTGMSLLGININNGRIIIPILNFFVDKLAIPFINPFNNQNISKTALPGSTWKMNDNMWTEWFDGHSHIFDMSFNFTTADNGQYSRIYTQDGNIYYVDTQNNHVKVYDYQTGWLYEGSKTITINSNLDINNNSLIKQLTTYLKYNGNLIAIA